MDSSLTRLPVTPTRAKSAGPSSPHRDPMEDADPSSTRKRPRLDSGDRAHRSMSADPLGATPSNAGLAKAPTTSPDGQPASQSFEAANGFPPLAPTPSKVTINVREPATNTSPTRPTSNTNDVPSIRGGGGGDEYSATHQISPTDVGSPSAKAISVNSSPPRSPEIEVAEVEDMNDDSRETRWKSLASGTTITGAREAKAIHALLLDQFPHSSGQTGPALKQTVTLMAAALQKNDLGDGHLLEELADWIESYLHTTEAHALQWWDMLEGNRHFWDELPSLVEAMMHRSSNRSGVLTMLYTDSGETLEVESPLQSFLVAYTSLALRMTQIDHQTLVENFDDAGALTDLISDRYLQMLYQVMGYGYPFWKLLVDNTNYDCKVTITAMMTRFMQPPEDGISLMTRASKEILDHSQRVPTLIQKFFVHINIMNRFMQHYCMLQNGKNKADEALELSLHGLPVQAHQFFLVVDQMFKEFISKQVPALSIDVSQGFVLHLSTLLGHIAASDEQLMRGMMGERLNLVQHLSREDSIYLVELAWKFDILKRCVFDGRMEIRVQGVETMQVELVNVYSKFISNGPGQRNHPIPQYLSDFMLANKLVEYFVGVESHPQLITRCGNIIGFLVVTHRYTEKESDIIWKAVTSSQDSHFVDTILTMMPNIFNIAQYPTLLYLTTKLNELPIHAFNGSMLNYGRSLLRYLRDLWKGDSVNSKMDMPPFNLCIRLIRQSAVLGSLEAPRKRDIHHFATSELTHLLPFGPSDADRKIIYQDCIQDISDHTDFASGSVSAINALLSHEESLGEDIPSLTSEWDLARLIVGDFAHTIEAERSTESSSQMLDERLVPRLTLIQTIILYVPDSITANTATQLWEYAVGSQALSPSAREMAWMMIFLGVIRKINHRNSFIDLCVKEHLPRLQPRFYTLGCLSFAREVSIYHLRTVSRLGDSVKQEPTAADLLWQLSLTAPSGTIERQAIEFLVALYLDSPENQRRSRGETEAIHIGVVERCIRQLTSAASKLKAFSDGTSSGEDEPMVIVASEDEVQVQRLSFSRSLTVLKEFIGGIRARPRYSPQLQSKPHIFQQHRAPKGNTIQIRYQSFGTGTSADIRTIEAGDLETLREFTQRLKSLTGFSKLTLISGGQKLDVANISDKTLQKLKIDQKGLLLVKRDADAESVPDLASTSALRPVEVEVLTYFPDMYQLLTMEGELGKEVFEFLVAFPPHNSITALVCSDEPSLETIFPPSAPFKVLYSVYALRQCLEFQTQNAPNASNLKTHGIRLLTAALSTLNLSVGAQGAEVDITVANHLLVCLTTFLQALEPMSTEEAESLFPDPLTLLNRLQFIMGEALAVKDTPDAGALASVCFIALLKISLRSKAFWIHFKDANVCATLLRQLLLEESDWQVRRRVADYIKGICADLQKTKAASAQEFIPYLWDSVVTVIPSAIHFGDFSLEFFEMAAMVFECMEHVHRNTLDLTLYVRNWSGILLRHEHDEFVGREALDCLVYGLSHLLHRVLQYGKTSGKTLPIPDSFVENLFSAHLFPEISNMDRRGIVNTRVPNLHTSTRTELYSILVLLSNNLADYQELLRLVSSLFPPMGPYAWSWGIAQPLEDCHYDQNWSFERNKSIRSITGYPGIRNLSNTCYMNSLFAQLFMNVKFRGFMLGTNVADGASSQRLLQETQTMFGFMQETMLKAVDSQGIAESLVTYDNTLIDVSVQMDVDEFYNLLFDRWEGQILLAADKKVFRGFYGGQIVQQIKSKECPHISERLEPFSAIQCDIKGKATLIDSLNAYVSGETMEGDNKYSCTSCGCYVDAVKRACLKDIPDNLIFHLKRFDYDVMTGMRSKINDAFEFPHQIDMAPYHVDYQMDAGSPCPADVFELVGVLVHSGTAESGHYYSYIKERPTNSVTGNSWVEFNDMDVTSFDPNNISDQCFGGYGGNTHYTNNHFLKNWNAYMLFYERMEPRSFDNDPPLSTSLGVPAKCAVPSEINSQVALSNAQFLRNYCMFEPAHVVFVRQLLEQLRMANKGACSESHETEKAAIWLSLDYLERVLSRSKDCSEFGKMLSSLSRVIDSCAVCCRLALEWVLVQEHALRDLLLRCPNPKVRNDFATMIVVALRYLKKNAPQWYGFYDTGESDSQSSIRELRPAGVFHQIVSKIGDLWTILYMHSRGWDDYFGLLTNLAKLGVHEVHVLLDRAFLRCCLELLVVEHGKASRLRNEIPYYMQYTRLAEKGRRYSLSKLADLLAALLEKIDLTVEGTARQHRRFCHQSMPLTKQEDELMQLGSDSTRSKGLCIFLDKILNCAHNTPATQAIVRIMILAEPGFGMIESVQKTIMGGINIEPAHLAEPFLEAAITFCEAAPTEDFVQDMIRYIAGEVETIGDHGGREHLNFFGRARRIVSLRDGFERDFFNRTVLRAVPQWAPTLLQFRDETVRNGTIDLLKQLVFAHDIRAMDDEEHAELIESAAKDLQVACTRRCTFLVQEQKPIDGKQVEQIIQVIRHCLSTYYTPEEDQRPMTEAETVLAALDVLTISDVDEAASDTCWNAGSDDMPTDSDSEFVNTSP